MEKREYLRKTAQYIYYHNYIRDMVNKISRFRRQLYREEHSVNQTLQEAFMSKGKTEYGVEKKMCFDVG